MPVDAARYNSCDEVGTPISWARAITRLCIVPSTHDPSLLCTANPHLFDIDGKQLFKRGNQYINEILPALEKHAGKTGWLKFKQLKNSR